MVGVVKTTWLSRSLNVRFSLLLASSALAAGLALSACSGNSQAIPGGAQSVAPMGHSFHLALKSIDPNTTCPSGSQYIDCYTVKPGKKFKNSWCISDVSPPTCATSGLAPGTWTWTVSKVYSVKNGKPVKTIKNSWKPNPGNPTNNFITAKKSVKSTKGAIGYYIDLEACNSASSCVGPDEIGIIVK
jgi:hypothetical protein